MYKRLTSIFCTLGFICVAALLLLAGAIDFNTHNANKQVMAFLITSGGLALCTVGMVISQMLAIKNAHDGNRKAQK